MAPLGMQMKVGSLCTGIAGLEHGLSLTGIQVEPAFVSDIDPGANEWLAANMPNVPNLGDFTQHSRLPPCDVLCAGFPCQPFSTAGKRGGTTDERYLFDDITRLLGSYMAHERPLVFLENVSGLLTSVSHGEHVMARVVYGLADIGYHITWGTLPAAAVGAPHRRNRWWGLAYPADADRVAGPRDSRTTPSAQKQDGHQPHSSHEPVAGSDPAADSTRTERRGPQQQHLPQATQPTAESGERLSTLAERFGPYAGAIGRWECVLGRTAPDPSVDGRLNPSFCEWMMGFPQGWVTDTLTNRNQALKALGNAVVPQCAAEAFTQLHNRMNYETT